MSTLDKQHKYEQAKKRVQEERGFYAHLTAYILVNLFIIIVNFVNSGFDLKDLFEINTLFVPFFWGIGLFFHWMKAFDKNPLFSRKWEERKINQILKEDDDFFRNL